MLRLRHQESRKEVGSSLPQTFVGREEELAELWDRALRRQNVLVLGGPRVGKTALLERLAEGLAEGGDQVVVFVDASGGLRGMLLQMAEQLHRAGLLRLDDVWEGVPWEGRGNVGSRVRGMLLPELRGLILRSLESVQGGVVVLLDGLGRLNYGVEDFVLRLIDLGGVVLAMDSERAREGRFRRIVGRFVFKVELKNLSEEQAEKLIAAYRERCDIFVEDERAWLKQVLNLSGGNPGALLDILREHSRESIVRDEAVRGLSAMETTGVAVVPVSWFIYGVLFVFVVLRYVGRGIGDRDSFIIGAIGMSTLIILGFLIRLGNRLR